jgi:hypothetical protein
VSDTQEKGRCGYEQFEPDNENTPITERQALEGINKIRDSIVGAQNINWSEHIYPLVSLLNRAGFEGLPYPEAQANIGTLIERTATAKSRAQAAEARAERLEEALEGIGRLQRRWCAPTVSDDHEASNAAWAAVGSEAHKIAADALALGDE